MANDKGFSLEGCTTVQQLDSQRLCYCHITKVSPQVSFFFPVWLITGFLAKVWRGHILDMCSKLRSDNKKKGSLAAVHFVIHLHAQKLTEHC